MKLFEEDDEKYLVRNLGQNSVVLFLGAGASRGAVNKRGNSLPLSRELAESLFALIYPDDEFDGAGLGDIYDAALGSGKPLPIIRNFLEENLLCSSIPKAYSVLADIYWFRVYTTNVDDLIFRVYQTSSKRAQVLAFPSDDVVERDQALAATQLIYLHGRLPCDPRDLTFSANQYVRGALTVQPLYEEFVRDYSYHPVVFLGTELNEPLFLHYVEARGQKAMGISEQRPKSFLIVPKISLPKRDLLLRYNIHVIQGSTENFLEWLSVALPSLPTRLEILQRSSPLVAELIAANSQEALDDKGVATFANSFVRVATSRRVQHRRSQYLLGAAPQWEDMFENLDAPRDVTSKVFDRIDNIYESESALRLVALLGSAGSGKSTILRRLGIRLVQDGRLVFLTNSEVVPPPGAIARALSMFAERAILLFDNSEIALGLLPSVMAGLESISHPPIIVIAARTNDFDRLWKRVGEAKEVEEYLVPHLNRNEIISILRILEDQGLLGKLRGYSKKERIRAFEVRADKQILVAMRETTMGEGFNKIIEDEFRKLTPQECQILYLCTAISTDAGYRLSKGEFVGCSRVSSALALHLLARNLRDVVIPSGPSDELLLLRHRLIAQHVLDGEVSKGLLREAYIRLLSTLATEISPYGRERGSRLYRAVINHKTIYKRFRSDIDEARAIFGALKEILGSSPHFWLQFGSLELEGRGGDLEYAENYLAQADSLDSSDSFIKNTMAHLSIKKGVQAPAIEEALLLRERGSEMLMRRISETSFGDDYAVHIYCAQRYAWCRRWYTSDDGRRREELDHLRNFVDEGLKIRPQHQRLLRLRAVIVKAYLQTGIPRERRPALPHLPEEVG